MALGGKPPQRFRNPRTGKMDIKVDGQLMPEPPPLSSAPRGQAAESADTTDSTLPPDSSISEDAADQAVIAKPQSIFDQQEQAEPHQVARPDLDDAIDDQGSQLGGLSARDDPEPAAEEIGESSSKLLAQILSELREINQAGIIVRG